MTKRKAPFEGRGVKRCKDTIFSETLSRFFINNRVWYSESEIRRRNQLSEFMLRERVAVGAMLVMVTPVGRLYRFARKGERL